MLLWCPREAENMTRLYLAHLLTLRLLYEYSDIKAFPWVRDHFVITSPTCIGKA